MGDRKRTCILWGWKWIIRRRLPYFVNAVVVLSFIFIVLVPSPRIDNGDTTLAVGTQTISSLPVPNCLPAIEDQDKRTDSVKDLRQIVQATKPLVMPQHVDGSTDTWVYRAHDTPLAQIRMICHDRSPPVSLSVLLAL